MRKCYEVRINTALDNENIFVITPIDQSDEIFWIHFSNKKTLIQTIEKQPWFNELKQTELVLINKTRTNFSGLVELLEYLKKNAF